jgi:hypothetical protein
MDYKNKMKKLYEDWKASKNIKYINESNSLLEKTSKNASYFNKFIESLGPDGERIRKYFQESQSSFDSDSVRAKRKFAQFMLAEEDGSVVDSIGLTHYPVTDRSKSVISNIQTGTPSGAPTEILRAIVGGNLYLAAQLTAKAWGKLTVADRNLIMQLAQVHGRYNTGETIPKDSGETNYYEVSVKQDVSDDEKIDKKSDLTKKEFLKQAFPLTDIENMKL